jgi:hypothetical protein
MLNRDLSKRGAWSDPGSAVQRFHAAPRPGKAVALPDSVLMLSRADQQCNPPMTRRSNFITHVLKHEMKNASRKR